MKCYVGILFLLVVIDSTYGKAFPPTSKPETLTETGVKIPDTTEGTTPLPWLRFLKNKKTTTTKSLELELSTSSPPRLHKKHSKKGKHFSESVRAVQPAAPLSQVSESALDDLINRLAVYFQSQYSTLSSQTDVLAQDRKTNPDSLYDELYLDWMKREAETLDPTPNPQGYDQSMYANNAKPDAPTAVAPSYTYPAVPLMYNYSPYLPFLTGLKAQKIMAQAQMDAALAAMNITTTAKPMKLKLKIQVPGNIDLTQLSQITAGLSNSLPPGSTYALA